MVIAHNLMAMNAENCYGATIKKLRKSTERLSSGYKINRAADDAAGLSISEKMRNQIRNLNQGIKNTEDGISFVQTADGALSEVHSILHRMEELSVQAANDTYTDEDRACIDKEVAELKKEISKVFQDTEFNTKKIFSTSYIPTVTGGPNDLQVFMTGQDQYGGIRVNRIRYTWDEIEKLTGDKLLQDDGLHFEGGRYSFTTYDGEDVIFDTKAGDTPPNVSRLYQWKATADGIYINNVCASRWEDMAGFDKQNIQAGQYAFNFHGMNIAFEVPDEDNGISMPDFLERMNGNGFTTGVNWSAASLYSVHQKSVRLTSYTKELAITDAWKDKLAAGDKALKLVPTDEGISLYVLNKNNQYVRINGQTDAKIPDVKWEDIPDISSGQKNYTIADWGTKTQEPMNDVSQITLGADGLYEFTEPITGMKVRFELTDEASLQQTKIGLSDEIRTKVQAPVETTFDDSRMPGLSAATAAHFKITESSTQLTYELQRETGKSFNTTAGPFETLYHMDFDKKQGDKMMNFHYDIRDNTCSKSIDELTGHMSYDVFYKKVTAGEEIKFNLTGSNKYGSIMQFGFQTDSFASTITQDMRDAWDKAAIQAGETAGNAAISGISNPDARRQIYNQEYNRAYQEAYEKEQKSAEETYVDNAITYLKNIDVSTRQTKQPTMQIEMYTKYNESMGTLFGGVKVSPPKKSMYIQSGANAGEDIYLEWPAMSLSTIGIGGASVKTREAATASMMQIQTALNVVSEVRSGFGAYQNRMMYEADGNRNYVENLTDSESQIRDTDMAETAMEYAKMNILSQVNEAVLAQANQSKQGILSMLQ